MDKLFWWMDEHNYRFRADLPIRLIGIFGRLASHLSDRAKKLMVEAVIPEVPPNMARSAIQAVAMLHKTAEPLLADLLSMERPTSSATGVRCTRARCSSTSSRRAQKRRAAGSATSSGGLNARRPQCRGRPSARAAGRPRSAFSSAAGPACSRDELRHDPGAIALRDDRLGAVELPVDDLAGAVGRRYAADLAAVVVPEAHADRLDRRRRRRDRHCGRCMRAGCGTRRRGGRACCPARAPDVARHVIGGALGAGADVAAVAHAEHGMRLRAVRNRACAARSASRTVTCEGRRRCPRVRSSSSSQVSGSSARGSGPPRLLRVSSVLLTRALPRLARQAELLGDALGLLRAARLEGGALGFLALRFLALGLLALGFLALGFIGAAPLVDRAQAALEVGAALLLLALVLALTGKPLGLGAAGLLLALLGLAPILLLARKLFGLGAARFLGFAPQLGIEPLVVSSARVVGLALAGEALFLGLLLGLLARLHLACDAGGGGAALLLRLEVLRLALRRGASSRPRVRRGRPPRRGASARSRARCARPRRDAASQPRRGVAPPPCAPRQGASPRSRARDGEPRRGAAPRRGAPPAAAATRLRERGGRPRRVQSRARPRCGPAPPPCAGSRRGAPPPPRRRGAACRPRRPRAARPCGAGLCLGRAHARRLGLAGGFGLLGGFGFLCGFGLLRSLGALGLVGSLRKSVGDRVGSVLGGAGGVEECHP